MYDRTASCRLKSFIVKRIVKFEPLNWQGFSGSASRVLCHFEIGRINLISTNLTDVVEQADHPRRKNHFVLVVYSVISTPNVILNLGQKDATPLSVHLSLIRLRFKSLWLFSCAFHQYKSQITRLRFQGVGRVTTPWIPLYNTGH